MDRIYLSPPNVGTDDGAAFLRAFDGGWITPVFPEVEALEVGFAAATGGRVASSSPPARPGAPGAAPRRPREQGARRVTDVFCHRPRSSPRLEGLAPASSAHNRRSVVA